jgi:hypothetical protein
MRTVEAVTEIAASAEMVWAVLTDFPRYPEWATYIRKLAGRAEPGASLRLVAGPPGRPPYTVHVPVLEATPGFRLAWAAVIPGMPWLPSAIFSGVHEFILEALPGGGTRLIHREYFSGLLSRLSKEGPRGADEGFDAFNLALKCRVLLLGLAE